MTYRIIHHDLRSELPGLGGPFDAVLCDPPYELGFMARKWDKSGVAFDPATWARILAVLRPGAHLFAFGGTRGFHRMTCAIEDAGFEIRDCLSWIYASGFPKSLAIDKAIDKSAGATREVVGSRTLTGNAAITTKEKGGTYGIGVGTAPAKEVDVTAPSTEEAQRWDGWGTALKPAWEPIVLARVPMDGTVAKNAVEHGVVGINVDGGRIGYLSESDQAAAAAAAQRLGQGNHGHGVGEYGLHDPSRARASLQPYLDKQNLGRWPANLSLGHSVECRQIGTRKIAGSNHAGGGGGGIFAPGDGTPVSPGKADPDGTETVESWDCVPDCPIRMLDEQSGDHPSTPYEANVAIGSVLPLTSRTAGGYTDIGGASRFFFCAKSSASEREFGLDALPKRTAGELTDRDEGTEGLRSPRAGAGRTSSGRANTHPTVKPISLTRWLATLALPPPRRDGLPRRILVPFAGVGSEMLGAIRAGWDEVVGIEMDQEYIRIAEARIARWAQVPASMDEREVMASVEKADERQGVLF